MSSNRMKSAHLARVAMFFVGVLLVATGLAHPAAAAADIEIDHAAQATVGQVTTVTATIFDGAAPVVDAEAALSFLGRIGGENGWVTVATGTTDADGVVAFEYPQRALDAGRMRVEYFGPDGQENEEFTLEIVDGPQLVTSQVGADLPIFGVWWLVIVLGIIWTLLILPVVWIGKLGRSSGSSTGAARRLPFVALSFVAFTAIGMFVVVLTRPESHANLDPTTPFDRAPGAIVGTDYDYTGFGLDSGGNLDELDGRALFIKAGCASCHGPQGKGALVGDDISGEHSVGSVIEDVREGPEGMPKFSEDVLSDAEIENIVAYLVESAGND